MRNILLSVMAGVFAPACIIVEDDHPHHHYECASGYYECSTSGTVDYCSAGYWVVVEDCWETCGGPGECGYDANDDAFCYCTGECTAGAAQCGDGTIEACDAGGWVVVEDCAQTCGASAGCAVDADYVPFCDC